jgi:hypothetical protein
VDDGGLGTAPVALSSEYDHRMMRTYPVVYIADPDSGPIPCPLLLRNPSMNPLTVSQNETVRRPLQSTRSWTLPWTGE